MNIRNARTDDAKKIAENNIKIAFESEGKEIPYNIALSGVKSLIRDENKGFYLLLEENDEIVGQLMITYEWSDWSNKNMWWIQSVYVDEKHRGCGVFKKLFQEIREKAVQNNVKNLRLYVDSKNKNAIKVYEKIGMKSGQYILFDLKL